MLIMFPFRHILTTTKTHSNKLFLCTARQIFMYMAGSALHAAQQLGYEKDGQGSGINNWKGQELLSTASRLAPDSGPVKFHTQWISGFFSREHTSEQEAVRPTPAPPKPTAEVYDTSQAFLACRQSFTPYCRHIFVPKLGPGIWAANFSQVSFYHQTKSHTHTHTHTRTATHTNTHAHTHVCTHTQTHTQTHTHKHTHTNTHTHSHTHVCVNNMLPLVIQWNLKPNLTLPEMHEARTYRWCIFLHRVFFPL